MQNIKRDYSRLFDYLNNKIEISSLILTFKQIEDILKTDLPPSAYKYNAWWSNNSGNHTHANSWLNAGWLTSEVKLGESVKFSKMQ